ncbi:MAG: NAD(P)-dependent alcohol dehydrogenase [Sandaracinaceae bacterium]|nr:NAD(P)-dependent alcohol dehydrogenase [Sandaracinaceae bacterium]
MRVAISKSHTEPLAVIELPSRPLRDDELRVKVAAIGVNPVDWKMREGGPLHFAYTFLGPGKPFVPGIDFAGEVIEAGKNGGLAVGTRVVGGTDFSRKQHGSYASEVIVKRDQVAVVPDAVSLEDAACLPVPAVTAWMAMREHQKIASGDKVLVLGAAGGVGLSAMQIAKMLGAQAVGVCSSRNVSLVEGEGAIAIDYTRGDALEAARAHGPYQVILQLVGSDVYPLAKCRALLTPTGTVEMVVSQPGDYLSIAFLPSVRTLLGAPNQKRLEPLVEAMAKGQLKARIEARFSLEDAEKAHEKSRSGKVVGKLLIVP